MAKKKRIFDKEHMNTVDKGKKKLFVWTRFMPYWGYPDLEYGLACAVAYDETSAKKMIMRKLGYDEIEESEWGEVQVFDIEDMRPVAFAVCHRGFNNALGGS